MHREATEYTKRVDAAGFDLDLGFIARGEIARCRRAKPGTRNASLFRSTIELVRCGINPDVLIQPALETGLPEREARDTVRKASAGFSAFYADSVLDVVTRWLGEWEARTVSRFRPLLRHIAAAAIRQNNLSPLIIQSDLDLGPVNQSTVSRWFSVLHDRGAIVRKSRGLGPRGRRPNFYELRLPPHESD
jgi:hypothetical protein